MAYLPNVADTQLDEREPITLWLGWIYKQTQGMQPKPLYIVKMLTNGGFYDRARTQLVS